MTSKSARCCQFNQDCYATVSSLQISEFSIQHNLLISAVEDGCDACCQLALRYNEPMSKRRVGDPVKVQGLSTILTRLCCGGWRRCRLPASALARSRRTSHTAPSGTGPVAAWSASAVGASENSWLACGGVVHRAQRRRQQGRQQIVHCVQRIRTVAQLSAMGLRLPSDIHEKGFSFAHTCSSVPSAATAMESHALELLFVSASPSGTRGLRAVHCRVQNLISLAAMMRMCCPGTAPLYQYELPLLGNPAFLTCCTSSSRITSCTM